MAASFKRIWALAAMEVRLLIRNRTTLFYAIAIAPITVLFIRALLPTESMDSAALGSTLVITLVGVALTMVVYYNLTTTAVARREELMLKRVMTGPASLAEALTAMAAPAFVIMLGQLIAGYGLAAILLDMSLPANALWLLVAIIGGTIMFALFAYASTSFTRSVESAQLTTMPFLLIVLMTSGMFIPLEMFGDIGMRIASATPLAAVVTVLEHGFGVAGPGNNAFSGLGEVGTAIVVIAAWTFLAGLYVRTRMPIEPRR